MLKGLGIFAVVAMTVFFWPAATSARLVPAMSYEGLFEKSDLVVICTALRTDPADDEPPTHSWDFELKAQNTAFKVIHPLKGKAEGDQIKVLHFKIGPPKKGVNASPIIEDGPCLVSFRSEGVRVTADNVRTYLPAPEYLLFLKRMADGRYEPVTGRIDPAFSVKALWAARNKLTGGD